MQLKYFILLLLTLFVFSCQNGDREHGKTAGGRWYKRYKGNIAGMQVVANLFFDREDDDEDGAITASGNYYYCKKSDLLDLDPGEIKNKVIQLNESSLEDRDIENAKHPKWMVTISDTGINGTWISADGTKTHPIHLIENYDSGAYAFNVITVEDSAKFKGPKEEYQMTSDYTLLSPKDNSSADGKFISKALLQALGADSLGAKDLYDFISISNKRDFKEYNIALKDLSDHSTSTEGDNNWENTVAGTLEYNDRGIVVLGFANNNYSGGAHPNYSDNFVCLDVTGKRVLRLGDILNIDTMKMYSLLEQSARIKMDIAPGDSLTSRLQVDTIPLTDNFIVSETGITFHYNPYEIASYAEGDFNFFVSYAQLSSMLKPEFRARMQQ